MPLQEFPLQEFSAYWAARLTGQELFLRVAKRCCYSGFLSTRSFCDRCCTFRKTSVSLKNKTTTTTTRLDDYRKQCDSESGKSACVYIHVRPELPWVDFLEPNPARGKLNPIHLAKHVHFTKLNPIYKFPIQPKVSARWLSGLSARLSGGRPGFNSQLGLSCSSVGQATHVQPPRSTQPMVINE